MSVPATLPGLARGPSRRIWSRSRRLRGRCGSRGPGPPWSRGPRASPGAASVGAARRSAGRRTLRTRSATTTATAAPTSGVPWRRLRPARRTIGPRGRVTPARAAGRARRAGAGHGVRVDAQVPRRARPSRAARLVSGRRRAVTPSSRAGPGRVEAAEVDQQQHASLGDRQPGRGRRAPPAAPRAGPSCGARCGRCAGAAASCQARGRTQSSGSSSRETLRQCCQAPTYASRTAARRGGQVAGEGERLVQDLTAGRR